MRVLTITIGLVVGLVACRAKNDVAPKAEPSRANTAAEPEQPQFGYPEGPWWLVDMSTLLVSGSHILISHRDAQPTHNLILAEPADRSRDEAMQRAWELYLMLRASPGRFSEVAARESDEPVTRSFGGSLGTLYANAVPPVFVDALGHVAEGEVTRPVETEQGFHVLRRLKASPPTRVSLAHIVIKYDGAHGWLRRDRVLEKRTRAEARALAERVAREAKEAPDRFASLVREYSDAENALRDGDLGSLSTYEVTDSSEAPLFAVAERMKEGAVSEVIELEVSGFHIVRRLPSASRPALAASVLTIGYIDSPLSSFRPNATRSRVEADRLARRLALQLERRPEQFDALRNEYCDQALCEGVTSWTQGRHLFAMEAEIEQLRVGQVSTEPIESPLGLLILRREDAAKHPPAPTPTPTFAFPNIFFGEGAASSVTGS